jgi:hypothetical protein
MPDHYHHASEVQGVADECHSHSARDVGAAEDNDVTMLERRFQELENDNQRLTRRVLELEAARRASDGRVSDLQDAVVALSGTPGLIEQLSGHVAELAGHVQWLAANVRIERGA